MHEKVVVGKPRPINQVVNGAREVAPTTCWEVRGRRGCVSERVRNCWIHPPLFPLLVWPGSHLVKSQKELVGEWNILMCNNLCGVIPTLYWFPMAAITNYHKSSGLKQHKLLSYSSGDQKSGMGLTELRSRCWQGMFLLEALGGILLFPASRGCPHFLACGLLPSSNPATVSRVLLTQHHSPFFASFYF